MTKTIIIADDHPLFRQALKAAVAPLYPQATIIEVETLAATQTEIGSRTVDLVLLDLKMADSHGLAGLMIIKEVFLKCR